MLRLQKIAAQLRTTNEPEYFDVVVIGSGISGVQSAEILALHGKSVVVLEANPYIGGRVRSEPVRSLPEAANIEWIQSNPELDRAVVEHGATWLSQEHTVSLRWAKELRLVIFEQYSNGITVYGRTETNYSELDALSQVYQVHKSQIMEVLDAVEALCKSLQTLLQQSASNPNNPTYQKMCSEFIRMYDRMPLKTYLEQYLKDVRLLEMVMHTVEVEECVPCATLSVYYILSTDGGAFDNLRSYMGLDNAPSDEFKIREGTEALVQGIVKRAEEHMKKPGLVRLNQPVTEILNDENRTHLQVITAKGRYKCSKVIWGVPLATSQHIKVSRLSPAKRMYFENQQQAFATKIFFIFKRAFWRSRFCGNVYFSEDFPFSELIENSPANLSCGILAYFLCADKVRQWQQRFGEGLDNPEIYERKKKYALKIIADVFLAGNTNHPELDGVVMVERSYRDNKYIRSCYQSIPRMGLTTDVEAKLNEVADFKTRDEHGIIFVGSEQSTEFATYLEGALRVARKKTYEYLGRTDPWLNQT